MSNASPQRVVDGRSQGAGSRRRRGPEKLGVPARNEQQQIEGSRARPLARGVSAWPSRWLIAHAAASPVASASPLAGNRPTMSAADQAGAGRGRNGVDLQRATVGISERLPDDGRGASFDMGARRDLRGRRRRRAGARRSGRPPPATNPPVAGNQRRRAIVSTKNSRPRMTVISQPALCLILG